VTQVLYETATGRVVAVGRFGNAAGDPGYAIADIGRQSIPAGVLTYDPTSGTLSATPPPPLPPPPDYTALRQRLVALAQSSVGVVIDQTTQAQRLALVACLLLRADAIDPVTLAIKPLNTWLYPP
jgi:hypothetical protein